MRRLLMGLMSAGLAACASAQVYTMTFDDLGLHDEPDDFYNGGHSALGAGLMLVGVLAVAAVVRGKRSWHGT